ncbi:hypothetical protein BDY21DRAFT_363717 [Lineolata rhizophorae]|uniref:Uncharacterized protein n=1 Tax=Lineolata rhizophorae TaxID=578093 RepID=A0A6A6P102_9PEZI|nr:hypothetical protein BDY21DRAFT_363717 [Lineolata rhizophorae]
MDEVSRKLAAREAAQTKSFMEDTSSDETCDDIRGDVKDNSADNGASASANRELQYGAGPERHSVETDGNLPANPPPTANTRSDFNPTSPGKSPLNSNHSDSSCEAAGNDTSPGTSPIEARPSLGSPGHQRQRSRSFPGSKRVAIAPPPIDTFTARKNMPEIVRTPYPRRLSRHNISRPSIVESPSPQDCILTFTIRRNFDEVCTKGVSRILIPDYLSSNSTNGSDVRIRSSNGRKTTFSANDFDDERFFQAMRMEYAALAGPFRFFSARTLRYISIIQCLDPSTSNSGQPMICPATGEPMPTICPRTGQPMPPFCLRTGQPISAMAMMRSPRYLASKGLSETFSSDTLMAMFADPSQGKKRFAWVHWAHRLASSSTYSILPVATRTQQATEPAETAMMEMMQMQTQAAMKSSESSESDSTPANGHDSNQPPPPLTSHPPTAAVAAPDAGSPSPRTHSAQQPEERAKGSPSRRVPPVPLPRQGPNGPGNPMYKPDASDDTPALAPKCVAGLEFVEGWSAPRIAFALSSIIVASVLASLLWVFLGTSAFASGYGGSGERVAAGMATSSDYMYF